MQQLTTCLIRRRKRELRLTGSLRLHACSRQSVGCKQRYARPAQRRSWQGCCCPASACLHVPTPTLLVQSNDERFKAELGKVIEMEVWEQAKAESSKQLKARTSQRAATQTEQAVRQQHADTLEAQVGHCCIVRQLLSAT